VPISAVGVRDLSRFAPVCKRTGQGKRAEYKQEAHTTLITTMLQLVHEWYLLPLLPGYLSVSARRITCMRRIYTLIIIKGETCPSSLEQSSPAGLKKMGPVFASIITYCTMFHWHRTCCKGLSPPTCMPRHKPQVTYNCTYGLSLGPDSPSSIFTARLTAPIPF
jgi:hypothetical protein